MRPGTLAQQVAVNTAVQLVGKATVIALSLVAISLTTRYLGQDAYGELTTIAVYVAIFAVIADWGLYAWTVREVARREEAASRLLGSMLLLRVGLATVLALLSIALAFALPYSSLERAGIGLNATSLVLMSASSTLGVLLQVQLRMQWPAMADVVSRLLSLGLIVVVVGTSLGGVLWFVAINVVAAALYLAGVYEAVRRRIHVRPNVDWALWKGALRASIPLGAALVVHSIYFRVDTFLLSLLRSTADVGIYGLAYGFYEVLLLFPGIFVMTILPVIASKFPERDPVLGDAIQRALDFLVIAGLPIAVGGFILAPELTRFIAGESFADSSVPIRILLVGLPASYVAALIGTLFIASDRQATALKLGLAVLVGNVALNLLLIPRYGYVAAATITTVSEAAVVLVGMLLVSRIYDFRPAAGVALRSAAATAGMALAVWLTRSLFVLVPLVVGAATYIALLFVTRAVPRTTLAELFGRPANG